MADAQEHARISEHEAAGRVRVLSSRFLVSSLGRKLCGLRSFPDRLQEWCSSKIRSKEGYDLLRQLFAYAPDKRLTAREAMNHKWFQDDPKPTTKYAHSFSTLSTAETLLIKFILILCQRLC